MAELKYRFVEEFERDSGEPDKDVGSPKFVDTKRFGRRLLHQIARCEYSEKTDEDGKKIKVERMGERGGWIESYGNLSQDGGCWVHPGAKVCMSATVIGNAQVLNGELGDWVAMKDRAVLSGSAELKEGAMLVGDAYVEGDAVIEGRAVVGCNVKGGSKIGGRARIFTEAGRTLEEQEAADEGEILQPMKGGLDIEDSEIDGNVFINAEEAKISKSKIGGFCEVRLNGREIRDAEISGEAIIHGSVIGPITLKDVFVEDFMFCGDADKTLEYFREIKGDQEYRFEGTLSSQFADLREAVEFAKKG